MMHIRQFLRPLLTLFLLLALLLGIAWAVRAADGGPQLRGRATSGGSVAASTDGAYRLVGAGGQPEAGGRLSGGGFSLRGGLIVGPGQTLPNRVYLPLVLRGP
jgi:hypothetical protein